MSTQPQALPDFRLAYYYGDRKTGHLAVISSQAGKVSVNAIPDAPATGLEPLLRPVLIGATPDRRAVLMDPKSKAISYSPTFPVDAFPAHVYSDPHAPRDWFMNDGDKMTGNDTVNCGEQGSSVTVVEHANSTHARFLQTICVGRGHHQAAFTNPAPGVAATVPRHAYISNLNDGTVSIIGNDPADATSYLKLLATINLCEPDKEGDGTTGVPNKAFPHGLAYSSTTGKVHNLNNGYGSVAVIDPLTHAIEKRVALKGYSNLFPAPGGRYLVARGADRKSDPQHVIAKLGLVDATTLTVVASIELRDIYLGKYFFSPDGATLYFTTGESGSPEQLANLRTNTLLVIDLRQLPTFALRREIVVGSAGTLAFLPQHGVTQLVFSSDTAGGQLTVIDPKSDQVITQIAVNPGASHSRIWLL